MRNKFVRYGLPVILPALLIGCGPESKAARSAAPAASLQPGTYLISRITQNPGGVNQPVRMVTVTGSGPSYLMSTQGGYFSLRQIGVANAGVEYIGTQTLADRRSGSSPAQKWHFLFVKRPSGPSLQYGVSYTLREQNGHGIFGEPGDIWTLNLAPSQALPSQDPRSQGPPSQRLLSRLLSSQPPLQRITPSRRSSPASDPELQMRLQLLQRSMGFGGLFGPMLGGLLSGGGGASSGGSCSYSNPAACNAAKNGDYWAADRIERGTASGSESDWYDR